MPHFLICSNPSCRLVLDFRVPGEPPRRSRVPLNECPECGSGWSANCPFCIQPLSIAWHHELPHCAQCRRRFLAARLDSAAHSRAGFRTRSKPAAALRAALSLLSAWIPGR